MSELFVNFVNMSISASWFILAVLMFRLLLKKAPKWINVLLWGVVAVRLVCPFSFNIFLINFDKFVAFCHFSFLISIARRLGA